MLLPLRCYLLSVIFFLGSSADLQDSPTELDEGRCGNSFSLLQREVEIQAKIDAGKEGVTHPQISPLNMEVGFIQQGEPDECTAAHLETLLKGLEKQNQKSLETVLTFPLVVLLLLSLIVLLMGHKLVTPVVLLSTVIGKCPHRALFHCMPELPLPSSQEDLRCVFSSSPLLYLELCSVQDSLIKFKVFSWWYLHRYRTVRGWWTIFGALRCAQLLSLLTLHTLFGRTSSS
eukprot:TRINITY_DN32879_c0_g1_i2.p1 TRINITY_DN32879_c0_g1~~TRINITY_DN32879_c0_g1_i2.p1  ORF type:complete len:231 (+),score=37.33 TRINITY_DN32879_c0_g1_i2:54-746(+)